MCGRFTLRSPIDSIASLFSGLELPTFEPRFNIAPTQSVACLRNVDGQRSISMLRWGLVPAWASSLEMGASMINARAETVASKPSFRGAFQDRRCLVLADGFFEWKQVGKKKYPFYVTRPDGQPFCMAGLWETWGTAETSVETCAIITTVANQTLAPLHQRMPVILSLDESRVWLEAGARESARLQGLLQPAVEQELVMREVSQVVNSVANDSPACIEPEVTLFD